MQPNLLPFTIGFGGTLVASVVTGDLVAAVAAKCPPGAVLSIQHPSDSAEVTVDPNATTREKNKMLVALKQWADDLQPTGPVIEIQAEVVPEAGTDAENPPTGPEGPVGVVGCAGTQEGEPENPTEGEQTPTTTAETPSADGAEVETHATCNGVAHELKTPVPKKPKAAERVRVAVGSVVLYTETQRKYVAKVEHLLPPGAEIIGDHAHFDSDYSYLCADPACQCNTPKEKV